MAGPVLGDIAKAAINQFGVDPSLVDDFLVPKDVPRTRTRTSHGLLIRVAGGRVIGAINGFTHTQSRQIDEEWEVRREANGRAPADLVPQNVTDRTISVSRYDLWTRNMEEVLNQTGELVSLADQFRPFSLRTAWRSPVGIVLGGRRVYEYQGCWFSRIGRTARSDDNRLINVDAEIRYHDRIRIA